MSFVKLVLFAAAIHADLDRVDVPDPPTRPPVRACGTATVYGYGSKWHGNETATGETFRPRKESTCASRTIPLGATVLVDGPGDESAWCRVNDRGPYIATPADAEDGPRRFFGTSLPDGYEWDGLVDLSIEAARRADVDGKARVCLRYLTAG